MRRARCGATLVMLAIAVTLTVPAVGGVRIDILTPPPFTAVTADHISIVGRSAGPRVRLMLPGREARILDVRDGIFHGRAPLRFGFNEIYLSSETGDSVWLAIVRLPFLSSIRRSRIKYPRFQFHGHPLGAECAECHALAPYSEADSTSPNANCRDCHPPEKEWIRPHRPVAEGDCRVCHGDGEIPVVVQQDRTQQCRGCHRDKIEEFNKEYQHGPVGAGECLACHNPHGSAWGSGLRMSVEELCTTCHEGIDAQLAGMVLHAPFAGGACTQCHDPHATNYAWGLSRRSNSVCLPCHSMKGGSEWHRHPVTGKPRTGRQIVEVNERGELECTSCHDPHYSSAQFLLRTDNPQICRGCHEDK